MKTATTCVGIDIHLDNIVLRVLHKPNGHEMDHEVITICQAPCGMVGLL